MIPVDIRIQLPEPAKEKAAKNVRFVIVKCLNVHILSVSYICSRILN